MGNDQKLTCSSCIVIETHDLKILPFSYMVIRLVHLKNIDIAATAFSPHNFKILPTCHMEFFWLSNPT